MPKRTLLEALASDNPNLWLKLEGGERLAAHREVLAWASTCAKALPPGDEWDLSGLVVEGAAVQRPTVLAWLEAIYPPADDQADDPEAAAVPLVDALAFADAVGSSKAIVRALCARHPCEVTVKVSDAPLTLAFDGRAYFKTNDKLISSDFNTLEELHSGVTRVQFDGVRTQVASQLERLLLMAYRLDIQELQDKLHHFLHTNTLFGKCSVLTRGAVETRVLSARVRAAVPRERLLAAWADHVRREPRVLGGEGALLQPNDNSITAQSPVRFAATLGRPYMGAPAGTDVYAELDLDTQVLHLRVDDVAHQLDFGLHLGK